MTGPNWLLIGESAGFADPILAAGLSLAQASAREAAFTVIELERDKLPHEWLLGEYEARNRRRIKQHIRFADYWYSANKHFRELKEYTREIARDAGLELDADKAFQWLGTGGFIEEDIGIGGFGTVGFGNLLSIANRLSAKPAASALGGYNGFVLNFEGAQRTNLAHYEGGRVTPIEAYTRDGKTLPIHSLIGWMVRALEHSPKAADALSYIEGELGKQGIPSDRALGGAVQVLEALVRDGWVEPRTYKSTNPLPGEVPSETKYIQPNRDKDLPAERVASSLREQPT